MRLYSTAYLAYGIQIPDTDTEAVEAALQALDNRVSYLTAGRFESQRTYLTTQTYEADAGEATSLTAPLPTDQQNDAWNYALKCAAVALGHTDTPEPGWLLIADLDN